MARSSLGLEVLTFGLLDVVQGRGLGDLVEIEAVERVDLPVVLRARPISYDTGASRINDKKGSYGLSNAQGTRGWGDGGGGVSDKKLVERGCGGNITFCIQYPPLEVDQN
jgi:hypothetical protein